MPHIRIRALSEPIVETLSAELPTKLAQVMHTSVDNFSVERIQTQFYKNGVHTEGDPMIEILWFDRGQELKIASAKIVTEEVQKLSNAEYVAVVFTNLPKESYFENGEHF